MRLTFVIPTLNEASGIRATFASIPFDRLAEAGYETDVIVVDGESRDGTAEAARELGARVVTEPRKGYGRAYKTGFMEAQGEIVVTGDADGTYPFERLPEYLDAFERDGMDFVTLDRYAEMDTGSMRRLHRLGNWVLSASVRRRFRVKVRDSQSGMWIIRRRALDAIPYRSLSDGMPFSQEIKVEALTHPGLKAAERPGAYHPRVGEAKLASWRDGFRNLRAQGRHRRAQRNRGRDGHA